jgi:hypothetical protein
VTAVGSTSVTIKTSAGTSTYTVTSNTDIDKLHAGNEARDMPQGTGSPSSNG